jgi:hypothetical protein
MGIADSHGKGISERTFTDLNELLCYCDELAPVGNVPNELTFHKARLCEFDSPANCRAQGEASIKDRVLKPLAWSRFQLLSGRFSRLD